MSTPDFRHSLHGTPYNETVAAKPPIPVTTAFANSPRNGLKSGPDSSTFYSNVTISSPKMNGGSSIRAGQDETPHDLKSTALQPQSTASAQDSQTSPRMEDRAPSNSTSTPDIPQIRVDTGSEQNTPKAENEGMKWLSLKPTKQRADSQNKDTTENGRQFQGLALDLPSGSLGDELQAKKMQFSNRGSMLLDGRKVSPSGSVQGATSQRRATGTQRIPTSSSVPEGMQLRAMSTDEEMLSEKVRLYYAYGSDALNESEQHSDMANKMGTSWRNQLGTDTESLMTTSRGASTTDVSAQQSPALAPFRVDGLNREEMELAGGLEDWQDIDNADVDRYGFIRPKTPPRRFDTAGINRSPTVTGQGLQRVSTSLQIASEAPRRKRTIRRNSAEIQNRSASDTLARTTSNTSTARPSSSKSATVHRHFTLRAASNRLPGNKDRRLMDEASDMLTLPRSLTGGTISRTTTMESDHSNKSKSTVDSKATSAAARRKETEREEKWRKMAKPMPSNVKSSDHKGIGGGMLFSFPATTDAKLISRTWKGIPDTWRAPAWHYFLSVSARKNPRSLPDDTLINLFYDYQDINSPDDVQIDIDVPRTISSHIMFRRRYRGGQRLLFRVLHAMSVHWPETGYVQGMAALAATLLSYYEEEKAFVMLVRLWECRGLGKLYKEGFGGLMEALNDFEHSWLGEGEVAKKLNDLNIGPTAYGTKWYLTLFNYSIPFPAQLRVWDVFILLGDSDAFLNPSARPSTSHNHNTQPVPDTDDPPFGTVLDILHATSAALIDGMRDILLDSDFENAMKVMTSWIPIRDEDLFMRVARAEYKMHSERRKKR